MQHGALSEARLASGELLYCRNDTLPANITASEAEVVADPDDDDPAPTRPANRQRTHAMEPYLQVQCYLNLLEMK